MLSIWRPQATQYCGVIARRDALLLLAPPRCHSVPGVSISEPAGMITLFEIGVVFDRHLLAVDEGVVEARADRPVAAPGVAAGDDLGGAIGVGELVDRPERAHAVRRTRPRHLVEAVVEVQRLRVLARVRVDRQACAQHEVGAEDLLADVEHQRVRGEIGEHRALGQQRVDALAVVALEVVAAHQLALQVRRQRVADRFDLRRRQQRRNDHVAVVVELLEQTWQWRVGWRVLEHAVCPCGALRSHLIRNLSSAFIRAP